jgi:glycosyltransferase involved in cell wall biosynthesis
MMDGRHLRILLSAYACEPGKGSEPGVGWNWAMALAKRGHDVWVVTRSNNRQSIENGLSNQEDSVRARLNFIYYDLPAWARWWKKGNRGVHLYYLLWQWGAYLEARRSHAQNRFDLVHHVTFVSVRQPSFMGNLGIPFIFGPVAGGEHAPWRLRAGYGWRGWCQDALRDVANAMVKFDPLMRRTFAQAQLIYATSEQTRDLIPLRYRQKTTIELAIALEPAMGSVSSQPCDRPPHPLRVLYVGRFLFWKGMQLGLCAFAELLKAFPDARLTLVGQGPDRRRWCLLAQDLHIASQIDWQPWMPQSELGQLYRDHDILFFPSLHDSGGMVALEAMAEGLPVVCLKLGGPGVLVDNTCGRAIDVIGASGHEVVQKLTDALFELADSNALRCHLRTGARNRAEARSWDSLANRIYVKEDSDGSGTAPTFK